MITNFAFKSRRRHDCDGNVIWLVVVVFVTVADIVIIVFAVIVVIIYQNILTSCQKQQNSSVCIKIFPAAGLSANR